MTLLFIIISPEVSCRPMLGPVRPRGWRGSKPLCGFLDIGVPLDVSQKVGKGAKKRNEGEGKRKHPPAFLSGLCTDKWIRFGSDSIYITRMFCYLPRENSKRLMQAICEKWQSKHYLWPY